MEGIRRVWDEKTNNEIVLPEDIPRLTEEHNKTVIDLSKGYSVDTRNLIYTDTTTLKEIARNVQLDVKNDNRDIIIRRIEQMAFDLPKGVAEDESLTNVVLYLQATILYTILYQKGQARCMEGRDQKGDLESRYYYNNGEITFLETWFRGQLEQRGYYDRGLRIGPQFNGRISPATIEYFMHGVKITKQQWLEYIQKSAQAVREIPSMILGVDAIINAYTNF